MREEKASSFEGSQLTCRVFVSKIESLCTTVGIGEGERLALALALGGEGKKSVTLDCDGDTSRRFLDFLGVPGGDVGARFSFGSALRPGVVFSNISSCSA